MRRQKENLKISVLNVCDTETGKDLTNWLQKDLKILTETQSKDTSTWESRFTNKQITRMLLDHIPRLNRKTLMILKSSTILVQHVSKTKTIKLLLNILKSVLVSILNTLSPITIQPLFTTCINYGKRQRLSVLLPSITTHQAIIVIVTGHSLSISSKDSLMLSKRLRKQS